MVRIYLAALVAAALAFGTPAAAQQAIGIASGVRNDVRIKKPGTPLPRPVQVKQRIALGDLVQTGTKSQLQVLLLDKSVFSVGANARLTIDKFIYDPSRGGRQLGATVVKGAFRFMSGKPDRGGTTQIRTPTASIGIRGTSFDCVLGQTAIIIASGERGMGDVRGDPATASLIILRGPGVRTQGNTIPGAIDITAGGRTVTVDRPLYAVFVPGDGRAPIGPFRMSTAGLMQVQALIFPSVAERLGIRGPADNLGGDPDSVYYPPTREGPSYPPPGALPGGPFPNQLPGANNPPPGAGVPGFNVPIPQAPPPRQRPNGQGTQGNNNPPPQTAAPPPGNNNPPPGGGQSLTSAPPPGNNNPTGGNNNPPPPNNPPPDNPPPPGKGKGKP